MKKQTWVTFQKYFPALWYYVGWFGCIYAGKAGLSAWTPLFPLVLLGALLSWKTLTFKAVAILAPLAGVGVVFDAVTAARGWLVFADSEFSVLPLWLISIWFLFILLTPLFSSLFQGRYILAAILGGISGPLSYAAGKSFEVLEFSGTSALGIYVFFWALYFPLCILVAGKLGANDSFKKSREVMS